MYNRKKKEIKLILIRKQKYEKKNVNKTKQIKLQCYSFVWWYVCLSQKECLLLFSSLLVLLLSDFF